MRIKRKESSVQELMGIKSFTNYGLSTKNGELLFFNIVPTNISVLSKASIETKIYHLMMVLSSIPDIEIVCADASECFDDNKRYLQERKNQEETNKVRRIIEKDLTFLDKIQTEMATARQFMLIGRCKNAKPEQVFNTLNSIEKVISEQGFEVQRMSKEDIKRFMALYFDTSFNGEHLPDIDGQQYIELGDGFKDFDREELLNEKG